MKHRTANYIKLTLMDMPVTVSDMINALIIGDHGLCQMILKHYPKEFQHRFFSEPHWQDVLNGQSELFTRWQDDKSVYNEFMEMWHLNIGWTSKSPQCQLEHFLDWVNSWVQEDSTTIALGVDCTLNDWIYIYDRTDGVITHKNKLLTLPENFNPFAENVDTLVGTTNTTSVNISHPHTYKASL